MFQAVDFRIYVLLHIISSTLKFQTYSLLLFLNHLCVVAFFSDAISLECFLRFIRLFILTCSNSASCSRYTPKCNYIAHRIIVVLVCPLLARCSCVSLIVRFRRGKCIVRLLFPSTVSQSANAAVYHWRRLEEHECEFK